MLSKNYRDCSLQAMMLNASDLLKKCDFLGAEKTIVKLERELNNLDLKSRFSESSIIEKVRDFISKLKAAELECNKQIVTAEKSKSFSSSETIQKTELTAAPIPIGKEEETNENALEEQLHNSSDDQEQEAMRKERDMKSFAALIQRKNSEVIRSKSKLVSTSSVFQIFQEAQAVKPLPIN